MSGKPTITTPLGSIEGVSQNITALATSIVFPVGEDTGVLLHLTGNSVGHNATFEGTLDGTNWFLIPAVRTDTFALLTATGVVAGNLTYGLWLQAGGCAAFRIRSTAHSSGTATWTASYEEEICFPPLASVALLAGSAQLGSVQLSSSASTAAGETTTRINATQIAGIIKASAGRLFGLTLTNHAAADRFVHIYNQTSAATLGTHTPIATYGMEPGQSIDMGTPVGATFNSGIVWAATTDNAAIPTSAATPGDISGTFRWL